MKAVIFDMDGTLVDSEKFHRQAYIDINKASNLGIEDDIYDKFLLDNQGSPDSVFVVKLVEKFGLDHDPEEIMKAKQDIFFDMIATKVEPFDGVVDLVREVSGKYKTALASSSRMEEIEATVDAIGIRDDIDVLVSGNKLERPKPHPDVFRITAEKLGVDIKDCLILEDSKAGLTAARDSGAVVLAFDNGEGDKDCLKDYNSFNDYNSMTLEKLEEYFNKEKR